MGDYLLLAVGRIYLRSESHRATGSHILEATVPAIPAVLSLWGGRSQQLGRGKGICAESAGAKHFRVAGSRRSGMAKSAWQNPNNRKGIIVDPDGTAENIRIGAIGTTPQAIADHGLCGETRHEVL